MNKINKNLIFAFIISLMINNQVAFGAEVKPAEEIKKEKKAQEKSLENPLEKYKLVVIPALIATILIGGGGAWYQFVRKEHILPTREEYIKLKKKLKRLTKKERTQGKMKASSSSKKSDEKYEILREQIKARLKEIEKAEQRKTESHQLMMSSKNSDATQ